MDPGLILGYGVAYIATMGGVFLLYLPVLTLFITLLIANGLLQLALWPFLLLIRRLRRRPPAVADPSWLFDRGP